jgi:hypothetical protein
MIFYTYLWLRENGTPYYVGKGKGRRAFRRGSPKDITRVLVQLHPSEQDAFFAEIFFIAYYGRIDQGTGILRNRTNGGDGTSGAIYTEERRDKMRIAGFGRIHSEDTKRRIGLASIGRYFSDEARHKMSEGNKGIPKPKSEETRKKISATLTGRLLPEETKRKISETLMGRAPSSETCHKLSMALRGKPKSLEARRKMSAAKKGIVPWNKGRTGVYSLEILKVMSDAAKNRRRGQ